MSFWGLRGSDLVLEHLEAGWSRSPQPKTSLSRSVQGPLQGRGFGRPHCLPAGHRSPALPLGTPSAWPGRSTGLCADSLPRRGLATLCPLTPPPPHVAYSPLPPLEAAPLRGNGTWDSQSCTPCAAAPPSSAAGAQRQPRRVPAPSPRAGADGSGTLGWARASAVFGRTLSSRAAAHAPPRTPHRTQAPPPSRPKLQPSPGPQAPPRTPA